MPYQKGYGNGKSKPQVTVITLTVYKYETSNNDKKAQNYHQKKQNTLKNY